MFEAYSDLRAQLRRRCTTDGVTWADVQWEPVAECLAIYTMDKEGDWFPQLLLKDENGAPRQIAGADIDEVARTAYTSTDPVVAWKKYRDAEAEARGRESARRHREYAQMWKEHHAYIMRGGKLARNSRQVARMRLEEQCVRAGIKFAHRPNIEQMVQALQEHERENAPMSMAGA